MSKTFKDRKVQHVQGLRRSNASGIHKNKVRDRQNKISRAKIWEQYIKDENE
jgi:hypothetical protein